MWRYFACRRQSGGLEGLGLPLSRLAETEAKMLGPIAPRGSGPFFGQSTENLLMLDKNCDVVVGVGK